MSEPEIVPGLRDLLDLPASAAPSPGLRSAVLDAVRAIPAAERGGRPVGLSLAPYRSETAKLHRLLRGLDERAWRLSLPVAGGWTVGDLVAHLAAVDGLLLACLAPGPDAGPFEVSGSRAELADRTTELQHVARAQSPQVVVRHWWSQVEAVDEQITAAGPGLLARRVPFAGAVLPVRDVLVDRAFETWIHADDVRGGLGLPTEAPAVDHLAIMADLAVQALQGLLGDDSWNGPDGQVRLVLTGAPAGPDTRYLAAGTPSGTRDRPGAGPGADAGPRASLAVDVVEFCRLIGGRRHPDDFAHTVTGDEQLGRAVLMTAAAMARR